LASRWCRSATWWSLRVRIRHRQPVDCFLFGPSEEAPPRKVFEPGSGGSQILKGRRLPRLLGIAAVAEHLAVSERHIRRLVAERRIPYVRWGHLLRFDPDEIADWLDARRRRPA